MRFVTFRHAGAARAGLLQGDGSGAGDVIADLGHTAFGELLDKVEPQLPAFFEAGWDDVVARLREAAIPVEACIPLRQAKLLAPLPNPRRIFGAAHNYRDALAERGMAPPAEPVLFQKHGDTVIGPGEAIVLPEGIGGVTYEAEIAAVIASRVDRVGPDQALAHVAAYGVFNDISASELIKRDGSFDRGKNLPTFGPFGPYLATADEIADPHALRIGLEVDGKALQDSSTAQMLFRIGELISILSHKQPLEPGDVIATGTPAGVAPTQSPPTWLRPGTTVTAWVEGLGRLANPIIEGPRFDG